MSDNRSSNAQAERPRRKIRAAIVLFVLLQILLPFIALTLLSHFLLEIYLYLAIWFLWCSRGKQVLFIYSRSPNWQSYIETELFPQLSPQTIIINWSDRKLWPRWSLAAGAFHHFLGNHEHTPSAIIFRPFHRVQIFRFHKAFMEAKHGNRMRLKQLEAEFLFACHKF